MITAKTKYGIISGKEESQGVYAFLGVPYARAPLGELRFRPPQEPEPWTGVRECTKYGAPSLQFAASGHIRNDKLIKKSSEDCLYLNIRTKAPASEENGESVIDSSARLPVYVFVHGGAYETGGGHVRQYEGQAFAEDGVVYVNINYRLSIFGALALDTLRGESGMTGCLQVLDAAQAVKWIYENIEAFGGDPENITVGGESAGAFTVSVLMCMPQLKGMFRRCILESGSIRAGATSVYYGNGCYSSALERSREIIAELGCDDTPEGVARLRTMPAEELIYKWHFRADGEPRRYSANPVLEGLLFEGDLVPDPRVQQPDPVDLLFGFNTDEGTMFIDKKLTEQQYTAELRRMFPKNSDELLKKYPVDEEHTPYQRLSDIVGLQKFKGAMLPYADVLSEMGMSVYAYHFDYMTDRLAGEGLGVRHIAELPFVFGSLLSTVGADDAKGREMSDIMHAAWVSFIKTGNPWNGWEKYTADSRRAMRFSTEGIVFRDIERLDEMLWLDASF